MQTIAGEIKFTKSGTYRYRLTRLVPADIVARTGQQPTRATQGWFEELYGLMNATQTVLTIIGRDRRTSIHDIFGHVIRVRMPGCAWGTCTGRFPFVSALAAEANALWVHMKADLVGWGDPNLDHVTASLFISALRQPDPAAALQRDLGLFG